MAYPLVHVVLIDIISTHPATDLATFNLVTNLMSAA
eukprot:CAMPEP_0178610302 /NCGR_PEP_ID=MMETSP0698-20121128/26_1 /TAXON_ID=265572 /ORGANISM="Extubocellulus spinifer, Strain CCMP396" /LENGTH=35 /DNA_ID= /DNA_START= /DNA_END= /DNA_ORIENTATION=